MKAKDDLLFASSVALIIGRSAEMVRKYERQGKLPALKTADGTRLFRRADVEKFLERQEAHRRQKDEDTPPSKAA